VNQLTTANNVRFTPPLDHIDFGECDVVNLSVRAFVQHYHEERPHQGLGNELIAPRTAAIGTGPITCRERLGGLLKFYDREAA